MIYNGIKGYVSGDLDQPVDTILAMTKGPIIGRNWNTLVKNPSYSITISAGAAGMVILEGTNDVAFSSGLASELNPVEMDLHPTEGATWSLIQAATSTSATGTFASEYQFLRLRIDTQGAGFVTQAWVRWS